jgi:hypothetical protein
MLVVEQWVKDNVEYLFDYALGYLSNVDTSFTPKFHMIDGQLRMAVISCDFWEDDGDVNEYGTVLDGLAERYGAIACLFVFLGKLEGKEIIGIVSRGGSKSPTLSYKHIIWQGGYPDFGPAETQLCRDVKNLKL